MLTCKEASYLISKKLDDHLTWRDRIALRLHLMMCKLCRGYASDVSKLHVLMRDSGEEARALLPDSIKLSEQSRERITQALSKQTKHQLDNNQ
ncbi:MAG TPA: zf-HC2 domain-containing protein [Crenotrichaceae bacterium]|nr:zf-HC2 domain-containing protein [Crenotrichaceae bacterium]